MTPTEAIGITRQFLQTYCADADGLDEMVNFIEGVVMANARPIVQGLKAIELVLADPPAADTILNLVTQDGHIELETPSPETAKAWLTWLTKQIRRELYTNLLPFQPIRAALIRIVPPADERFPHDLLLYPTDESYPEYWEPIWQNNIFYKAFLKEWDGQTCPTCQSPTIQKRQEKKYMGEIEHSVYSSTLYYDIFAIYKCTSCQCGWTERTGSEQIVEVSFP